MSSKVISKPINGARHVALTNNAYKWNCGPNATDTSTPRFANNDEHVAAVMAAGGFGVLNVNGHRR